MRAVAARMAPVPPVSAVLLVARRAAGRILILPIVPSATTMTLRLPVDELLTRPWREAWNDCAVELLAPLAPLAD